MTDRELVKRSEDEREWDEHIFWGRAQGAKESDLIEELVQKGYDRELVVKFAQARAERVDACRFEIKLKYIYPGIAALLIGVGVTGVSMYALESGAPVGFVWHGACIYGVLSLLAGYFTLRKVV